MPHGHPDWGQAQQTSLIAGVSDLGELAARLDSPDTYIRTGNVIYLTDWEDGINDWRSITVGVGAAISADTTAPYRRSACLALLSGTTAGSGPNVQKMFFPPRTVKVGLETMFAPETDDIYPIVALRDYNGATLAMFAIRYDPANDILSYLNSAGTYTQIVGGLVLRQDATAYHLIKLVVDLETRKYVRAIVNHVIYDLAGIAPQVAASAVNPSVEAVLQCLSISGTAATLRCDSTIITINEP